MSRPPANGLAAEEFLLSGEFHYFRVPRDAWRDRLRTMAGAGLRAVSIYVPWNWHAPAPDVTDFTGKDIPERDLPAVLEEIAAAGLACIFRPGPFITAEWRNGGIPDWLLRGDLLARDADGNPSGAGRAYPVLTYAHPQYQARARTWLEQALAVAREHGPVANVQLDDEPSYWRTLLEPLAADYNPYLIEHQDGPSRYARWLIGRHGSLDAVRRAYRVESAQAYDFGPPREPARDPVTALRHLDWLEFKLAQTNEHVEYLYEIIAGIITDCGISLLHPFLLPWSAVRAGDFIRDRQLPIQLTNECYLSLFTGSAVTEQKLGAVLACHETYQMWGRGTGAPVTIELQGSNASYLSAGAMELLYALTVARGIRGLNYYMMAGGTNPPGFEHITGAEYDLSAPIAKDGTTRAHYDVIGKVSRIMGGWLGGQLESAVPVRDVWLGCYAPYEMAAVTGGAAALGLNGLAETFDGGDIGMSAADSLPTLMALNSVSFGCLDIESATPDELAATPRLWVPGGAFLAADVQRKLADYVRGGGDLVLLPDVPRLDATLEPCTVLAGLAGGANWQRRTGEAFVIYTEGGETLAATGGLTTLDVPPDGEVLARDAETGQPCAFRREAGAGRVTFLGFGLRYRPTAGPGQHDFLLRLVPRAVRTSEPPFAAFRLQGPDAGLLCVANPLDRPGTTTVHYAGGEAELEVEFAGRGAVLLPVDVRLADDVTLRYATWELLDVEVSGGRAALTFATRGKRGLVCVTTGRYENEVLTFEAAGAEVRVVVGG
jgi:beta-galactosidase